MSTPTITVTHQQACEVLSEVSHAVPIWFTAVTSARAKLTGNPWAALAPLGFEGGIIKVARISAMLNTDHQAAVERRQIKEGAVEAAYQLAERCWGKRHGALVEHKGEWYIAAQINTQYQIRPVYMVPRPRPDGRVILTPCAKEIIADLLPADRTAQVAEHQGVTRPVIRRDYALTSIVAMAIGGHRYRIRQPATSLA